MSTPSLRWQCVVVDCHDPDLVASFWQEALGWRRTHENLEGEDPEIVLEPPAGSPEDGASPDLLFGRGQDPKLGKNRLHFDLRPLDQAAEVARLEQLGAARTDIGQGDVPWIVMTDPEGNEFCVLRPLPTD
jgi:hypothetical protein